MGEDAWNGGTFVIGREADGVCRCAGAESGANGGQGQKGEAHHGYIPGASHVRRSGDIPVVGLPLLALPSVRSTLGSRTPTHTVCFAPNHERSSVPSVLPHTPHPLPSQFSNALGRPRCSNETGYVLGTGCACTGWLTCHNGHPCSSPFVPT